MDRVKSRFLTQYLQMKRKGGFSPAQYISLGIFFPITFIGQFPQRDIGEEISNLSAISTDRLFHIYSISQSLFLLIKLSIVDGAGS